MSDLRGVHGPLAVFAGGLESWLASSGCAPGRARRTVLALGRLSSWLAGRGIGLVDLTEDVIDEYVAAEQARSGSRCPAAVQYLPAAKRFLASQGVLTLRGLGSRRRGGIPRLAAGPLSKVVHAAVMRRRREWFTHLREVYAAAWWIPAGTVPTVGEAEQRLTALRQDGPTPYAFSLAEPFPPPDADHPTMAPEDWYCPA